MAAQTGHVVVNGDAQSPTTVTGWSGRSETR